jgi:hypothetical protein
MLFVSNMDKILLTLICMHHKIWVGKTKFVENMEDLQRECHTYNKWVT